MSGKAKRARKSGMKPTPGPTTPVFKQRKSRAPLPGVSDPRIHRLKRTDKPRRSIKLDVVHPADFRNYDVRFFCDDCSHYDSKAKQCTIGFVAQHTRVAQMKIYELTGKIAFCRFIEID